MVTSLTILYWSLLVDWAIDPLVVTLGYVHLLHTPCMQKVALYLHPVMGITHVFSCINNCWKLLKLFEHVALILVFKHLTSDPANVNAMKQMGDHSSGDIVRRGI